MLGVYLSMLDTAEGKSLFEELYLSCRDMMYNCAFKILGDSYLAEDAVHNAFLSAAKYMDKISGMTKQEAKSYLLIISRNAAYAIYKDSVKNEGGDIYDEALPADKNIELDIEENDLSERVFRAVKKLDKIYSDALVLKLFYDMENTEIAEALGISAENAGVRIFRGKQKLKKLLCKEDIA